MKTTSVTAHYERKLNTGNYSSVTLSAWATVEVEDGDAPGDAMQSAMTLCREQVIAAAQPFVKKSDVTDESVYAAGDGRLGAVISPSEIGRGGASYDDNLWKR